MSPARGRRRSPLLTADRFSIFVPAIMSVGLVFWVVSEVRELWRARTDQSRDKRAALAARALADQTFGRATVAPHERGLRPRPVYLLLGLTLVGTGVYVAVGSVANHQRSGGYVSGITWLLVVALWTSSLAFVYGVAALRTFARWPTPPPALLPLLRASALTTMPRPADLGGRPSWRVTATLAASGSAAALLAFVVAWSPHAVDSFDRRAARALARVDALRSLSLLDPLGTAEIAIGLAALAALAALRCRVLAVAYAAATTVSLAISLVVRPLVARPRPGPAGGAGPLDSFPSGHVLLATLFAGAFPLAVAVFAERPWIVRPLRAVLATGVVSVAIERVSGGEEWPTDVLAGALFGVFLVTAVQWVVDEGPAHGRCHHCPWSPAPPAERRGAVAIGPAWAGRLRVLAHTSAAAAALGLSVLGFTRGVPVNPDGYGIGAGIQRPTQLALAALVSVGAALSWRWEALGAVVIAFAAAGLGVMAAVQYAPPVAVAMTAALAVPSVLLWLSWQRVQRPRRIIALALATFALLGLTWGGARSVYRSYVGPAHPQSAAPGLRPDRVEWAWSGALGPTSITVAARLTGGHRLAQLVARPEGSAGGEVRSPVAAAGTHRVAVLRVEGLRPGSAYLYALVVDGVEDRRRGRGTFTTPVVGPQSFRFAFASCARTGSNGQVFDAIRSERPLLYLPTGDMHYSNVESTAMEDHLRALDRVLTRPAQAALYREVPVAYVWDDHDYAGNDSDASSPGRAASRAAYRTGVPHYPLARADGPIAQAFTVGRARFILTDARSERTDTSMLGEAQLRWFLDELRDAARTHAVVFWVNSVPWIGAARPGADGWAGYGAERGRIADAIAEAGIRNLVMLAGDAHMLAIDDGTHSDYSSRGGAGFPVFHAAALDRPGSVKGGPYSEGAYPGAGQYGVVEVEDGGGSSVRVRLTGKNWKGETLVRYEHTFG